MVVVIFGIAIGFSGWALAKKSVEVDTVTKARLQKAYGKLPLSFIRNDGQLDERVNFYEKGRGHSTFFTQEGVYLWLVRDQESEEKVQNIEGNSKRLSLKAKNSNLKSRLIKLFPLGGNKSPEIIGEEIQIGKVNYFIGNDKKKWRTNIPTCRAVMYKGVYDEIDMRFYGNNRQLEYDVIVRPGGDPSQVKFSYEGVDGLKLTEENELLVDVGGRNLIHRKPYIYQEIGGKRVEIAGAFKIYDKTVHGFEIASYNKQYPLIIDPILVYSTYLGGTDWDNGYGVAVDTDGNAYITGYTNSTDFPIQNPFQGSNAAYYDVFVTKLNASGSSLLYSTYLGGSNSEYGLGIAIDTDGNAYITGYTPSIDFPTENPIQMYNAGNNDVFVTKLDASGTSLVYSTYLGGIQSDQGRGIAVDTNGNAYITGSTLSSYFPTQNPFQGNKAGSWDAFVTKIDASGSSLAYSTYLGGTGLDDGYSIAVDTAGNAYVTGYTESDPFPTQNSFQGNNAGGGDAFVTKIDASGSSLAYSTHLGGSNEDRGRGIAVDTAGNAYITGYTDSPFSFPTQNPIQGNNAGGRDAFVTKLNASGASLVYSTYLGGSSSDAGYAVAVDNTGKAYVTGYTYSDSFPTQNPIQAAIAGVGTGDAFVTKLDAFGTSLLYSTYLGGSSNEIGYGVAVNTYKLSSNAYITGKTYSDDFPTQNPIQVDNAGDEDAFVTKIASLLMIISVEQLFTEDETGTWDVIFARRDLITVKAAITILGAGGVYDLIVKYLFIDFAGEKTLLDKQIYRNCEAGTSYLSQSITIPENAALGRGKVLCMAILRHKKIVLDRAKLSGFVNIIDGK